MNGQMDKSSSRLVRNQAMQSQACSWALLTDVKSTTGEKVLIDARNTTDVTGKLGNGSRNGLNYSENPTMVETWVRNLLTPRWERKST